MLIILMIFLKIIVICFFILIPLIPTILIYKIFPSNKIFATGPLHGLTVKMTGSFAGYIIIVLILLPFLINTMNLIDNCDKEKVWTIIVNSELKNKKEIYKKIISNNYLSTIHTTWSPYQENTHADAYNGNTFRIKIKVISDNDTIPDILQIACAVDNFGNGFLKLKNMNGEYDKSVVKIDKINRLIQINPSIVIEKE